MDARAIFFVGRPGCGKGTQAKLLSELTGWRVISAGEELRALSAKETPLGRKIKSEVDVGMLVPYWFVTHLYLEALSSLQDSESAVFDGFNRRVPEAQVVVESLAWLNRPYVILNIVISDDEARRRLLQRKEVEGRADDEEAVIEARLKEYHEHTEAAIGVFESAGMVHEINGEQAPEKIAQEIRTALALI
jgi:adenylate kinase